MKRTFYTMLLATALALPASYASAQIGVSSSTGVNVGVGGVNADVSANSTTGAGSSATTNSGTNDTTRLNYNNDSSVRSSRDRNAVNGNTSTDNRVNTRAMGSSTAGSIYSTTDLDAASVRSIQQSLNDRGYNVGKVDGKWNSSTSAQLRKFESSQGLTASSGTSLNARSLNQLGVNIDAGADANVNSINPSAGTRNITPSVRSGVSGSTSYNP